MTPQPTLYILIAVNCVLGIANVINALKLKTLITQMKKTRAQIGLGALYVRGVDVSEQFNTILDQQGLRMHQTILPTAQSLSDAEAYEKIVEGSRPTFGTSKKAKS